MKTNNINTYCAIKTGNLPLVKERIKTHNIHDHEVYNYCGLSALNIAVMHGQNEIVRLLISEGASITSCTNSTTKSCFNIETGSTSLHLATIYNKRLDILQQLIEAGASAEVYDDQKNTPLSLSIDHENLEMVTYLLKKMQWDKGACETITKIFLSIVEKNNYAFLELFIKPELLDVNTNLTSDKSLLYHAVEINNMELSRLLIKKGADVNFCYKKGTENGCSIVYAATKTGNSEMVKLLIENKATIVDGIVYKTSSSYQNFLNSEHVPILYSIKQGFTDIVKILVGADADIFISTEKTLNPLALAIEKQNIDVIKVLVEDGGATIHFMEVGPNRNTRNLFLDALATKNEELISYLLEEGMVLDKYLDKNCDVITNVQHECISRLHEISKSKVYKNNEQIVKQFLTYLSCDKDNFFNALSKDIIVLISHYTAVDIPKLNYATFKNYIIFNPVENYKVEEEFQIIGGLQVEALDS